MKRLWLVGLILTGCGKDSSSETQGVQFPAEMQGTWLLKDTSCVVGVRLIILGEKIRIVDTRGRSKVDGCSVDSVEIIESQLISISGNLLETRKSLHTVVFESEVAVEAANRAGTAGYTDWQIDVVKDIFEISPQDKNSTWFVTFNLDGDNLATSLFSETKEEQTEDFVTVYVRESSP